jgi:ankyrin repeat protein
VAGGGHKEVAELLIAKGADVNPKREDGATPLLIAAVAGHKEVAELLIAKGADVNAKDKKGWTLLQHAVMMSKREIVGLLITKGADVNAKVAPIDRFFNGKTPLDLASKDEIADLIRKHGGKTAEELKGGEPVVEAAQPEPPTAKAPAISIHNAAWDGNIEAVKQHLAAGTDVNAKNKNGWTPLHFAAFEDHKEIAELLIAKGADVNAKNRDDWTPLHFAALEDHKEITELLIAKGADVNAKDVSGETPLDVATHPDNSNASAETADLLRKHGGKSGAADSIHVAAAVVNIEAVKQHLAAGADVNAKNKLGSTPLHKAAAIGSKEIAELLIAKGADVNANSDDDGTPLDWAISRKRTETADLLRKHGGKTGEELKAEGK